MASTFALTLRNNAGYLLQLTVLSGGQPVDTTNWHAKFAVKDSVTGKQQFQVSDTSQVTGASSGTFNITFGGVDGKINIILTPDLYNKLVTGLGAPTTFFDIIFNTPSQVVPLTLLNGPVTFQQGAASWT